ncbi:MAG: [FeFe] hydrogenase H-cluster maturation GTPase HydF [Clostridiaceae bacterium]|nr:[FeFe] hydrogenase H-cluster maturation GTPase HydF [Clostridiaceae bacterium]
MEKTPLSQRKHIVLYGKTNSGKSSLFNKLIGQDYSIISEQKGTTTDPVVKAAELIPYGPVAFIDTAGIMDESALGELRVKKTQEAIRKSEFLIYVKDVFDKTPDPKIGLPYITVFTKCDLIDEKTLKKLKKENPGAVFVSNVDNSGIEELKERLIESLRKLDSEEEQRLISDLLPAGSTVIMVVPIDSEAPKGRLILPQVMLLRECLDCGIKSYVVRPSELESALSDLKKVDLVITDSQAFFEVDAIVPKDIMLTSFSMLLARQKGDFFELLRGAEGIKNLKDGSTVLMHEGCTHNSNHEDIGRVKIPKLLQKHTGKSLNFEYYTGYDFPKDLSKYDLAIACGNCMITKKAVLENIRDCKRNNVPITNYGIALAYLNGILKRASEIFMQGRLV